MAMPRRPTGLGITLRSLMLARLYANRFLIQNDDESFRRVGVEFLAMEQNIDELFARLENPHRIERATKVRDGQRIYARAFEDVHDVITSRNDIIRNQPRQDRPEGGGPGGEAEAGHQGGAGRSRAEVLRRKLAAPPVVTLTVVGGVHRLRSRSPPGSLASGSRARSARWLSGMRELADGNLDADIDRRRTVNDEIREMAEAVQGLPRRA